MPLPYKRIPAGIAAYTDPTGKIPASQLSNVPGVGDFQLQAARSMRALVKQARADGLVVASVGDFRSFDEQRSLFLSRYVHGRTGSINDRFWHSGSHQGDDQWWKLVTGAAAAEPGTSNHGLGLANDFALNVNGQIVTLDTKTGPKNISLYDWLSLLGGKYGWSWGETSSERWHWVYIEGDVIPAAVLSFERAHNIVLDYAFTFTDPLTLAASGINGVVRYAGDFTRSKVADRVEINAMTAAGLSFAAVFEDSASSWQSGYAGGLAYGREVLAWRRVVGWPDDRPVHLANFDTNIPASLFPHAAEHMQGYIDGQGLGPIHAPYGEGDLIDYFVAHGLAPYGWQSASDSFPGNAVDTPNAAMCQRVRASFPQFPAGTYDENDIKKSDWGQIPRPTGDTVAQSATLFLFNNLVYLVPDHWQSKLPLGAANSPAVKEMQGLLAISGLDSTIHPQAQAPNMLALAPLLTDDATALAIQNLQAQITALATKIGVPAQATVVGTPAQSATELAHYNALTQQIASAPPGSGMSVDDFETKQRELIAKTHQDALPGHLGVDP